MTKWYNGYRVMCSSGANKYKSVYNAFSVRNYIASCYRWGRIVDFNSYWKNTGLDDAVKFFFDSPDFDETKIRLLNISTDKSKPILLNYNPRLNLSC